MTIACLASGACAVSAGLVVVVALVTAGLTARRIVAIADPRRRLEWAVLAPVVYAVALLVLARPLLALLLAEALVRLSIELPPLIKALRKATDSAAVLRRVARAWPAVTVRLGLLATATVLEPVHPGLAALAATARAGLDGLRPAAGWLVAALVLYTVAKRILRSEPGAADARFAGAIALLVFSVGLVAGGRPAAAALAVAVLVDLLMALSAAKFRHTGMNLHAYDLVAFPRDRAALRFLIGTHRGLVIRTAGRALAGAVLVGAAAAVEPVAIDRIAALGLCLVAALLVAATRRGVPAHRDFVHYARPVHLARLALSAGEALQAWRRGGVLAVASPNGLSSPAGPVPGAVGAPDDAPPDIVLILSESTFPPPLYGIPLDPELAGFFRSADGRSRGLRVETFGGMSWRTEFSVLTGIPSGCYGAFATHVFHWATGRVRTGLPARLARRGYRSTAVYSSVKSFVGTGAFYDSVGFDTVLDRDSFGIDSDWAPDRFYYDRALDWLQGHAEAGGGPAFLYVVTSSNHFPHDRRFDGGMAPPTPPIAGTETDEYMRRLRASAQDYAALREALARRVPSRRVLIVRFGDHQPPFTARLLGHDPAAAAFPEQAPREELAYRTFFAVDGIGTTPVLDHELPDEIEAAYLGTVLTRAAGLPLDPLDVLRYGLMVRLDGRLYFADDGRTAARLNGRMVEQGLLLPH